MAITATSRLPFDNIYNQRHPSERWHSSRFEPVTKKPYVTHVIALVIDPGNVKVSCREEREGGGERKRVRISLFFSRRQLGGARAYPRPSVQTEGGENEWTSERSNERSYKRTVGES